MEYRYEYKTSFIAAEDNFRSSVVCRSSGPDCHQKSKSKEFNEKKIYIKNIFSTFIALKTLILAADVCAMDTPLSATKLIQQIHTECPAVVSTTLVDLSVKNVVLVINSTSGDAPLLMITTSARNAIVLDIRMTAIMTKKSKTKD